MCIVVNIQCIAVSERFILHKSNIIMTIN